MRAGQGRAGQGRAARWVRFFRNEGVPTYSTLASACSPALSELGFRVHRRSTRNKANKQFAPRTVLLANSSDSRVEGRAGCGTARETFDL